MDSFHDYLKKQLIEYVEAERSKGIPLEEIEKVLLDAGHKKNIIDEVFHELEAQASGKKVEHKDPVEKDLVGQLKNAFAGFMAKSSDKEIKAAKEDFKKTDTREVVEEVIDEVEIIEEKTMLESFTFFLYLIFLSLLVLFSAGSTESNIVSVVIGFFPLIISVFVSFMLLKLADNVPLYMFIPLAIATVFFAVGKFTNFPIFSGKEIEGLAIVNFLLGFLFNVLIVYVRFVKPKHMKRRIVPKPKSMHQTINELRRM